MITIQCNQYHYSVRSIPINDPKKEGWFEFTKDVARSTEPGVPGKITITVRRLVPTSQVNLNGTHACPDHGRTGLSTLLQELEVGDVLDIPEPEPATPAPTASSGTLADDDMPL